MEMVMRATEAIKGFRETRLSALRPPNEFFDFHRISRPADFNTAASRISYNTKYFSGNYTIIVALLAVYALISSPWLLISIAFLFGGFAAISRFAPESMDIAGNTITQRQLYIGLFVIGIPMLLWNSPFGAFFWLVGASCIVIFGHACMIEPGIESEYATVHDQV